MNNIFEHRLRWLLHMFVCISFVLLPWQTVWIVEQTVVNGFISPFNTLLIYASELVVYGAILIWLVLRVRFGISKIHASPRLLIVTLFFLVIIVSLMRAENPWLVIQALSWFSASVFLALSLIHNESGIYAKLLCVSLIISGVLGMYQFAFQRIDGSVLLGISEQSVDISGTSIVMHQGERLLRAFGSFPHPNIFGGYMAVLMLISGVYMSRFGWLSKVGFLMGWIGVLISFSRSAFLMACVVVFVLFMHKEIRTRIYSILPACAIFLLLFLWQFGDVFAQRVTIRNEREVQSVDERMNGFRDGLSIVRSHVWLGVGLHNYTNALRTMDPIKKGFELVPVHNVFILVLVELGFVMMVLCGWLIFALRKNVFWRVLSVALCILFPALMFDHYVWSLYAGIMMSGVVYAMSSILNTKSFR